jgi:hypothetical protein
MRPVDRVLRTRRALGATIAARALLVAAGVALAVAAVASLVARRAGADAPWVVWALAWVSAIIVLVVLLRQVGRLTVERVALWIEERAPRLQYSLVTAVDPVAAGPSRAMLERHVEQVTWDAEAGRAMARALRWPTVLALVGLAAFLAGRRVDVATLVSRDKATPIITPTRARNASAPFARLTATVRAPTYAGGRVVRVESPASIAALVGSSVTLEAPGTGDGISADLDEQRVPVQRQADTWRVAVTIGPRPALVRLHHAAGERIVALEPRPDSVPDVRLLSPTRDTVMRVARGAIALSATAHDDIGLASVGFEYIVSSGEGESFRFRSGTLGARRVDAERDASAGASLRLDALALEPGDIVHQRAVARDGNTIAGPSVGASETRVLRVARTGEYDSIAVEGAAPPDADKSLISQRMLIILTEALEKRRPTLGRETLLAESRSIARDQTRLRKRVGDIIFARLGDNPSGEEGRDPSDEPASDSIAPRADSAARDSARRAGARAGRSAREVAAADSADSARAALLRAASAATGRGDEILDFEGDETPVVAINRPLLEAYNAMWEATRELDQGATGPALPPMRRALAAIQRARQAERIYLRGKAPTVVVDLGRIRLTGKDKGGASLRAPRTPADAGAARRAERLAAAIALAATSPPAAIDSIVLLRVESIDTAPQLATALADALEAMRNGRDATALLTRARRIADGSLRGSGRLGAWSGVW